MADPMRAMDWVNLFALAVNEENAAGHRVVTAPTNGAAGVIPAVLGYLVTHCPETGSTPGVAAGPATEDGAVTPLAHIRMTADSSEDCSDDPASPEALGLTCDPVAGLVQVPCIERNAIAAVKAINAARMALWGDGRHTVSLDVVIETMRQTGNDMLSKYKETSEGGLAVNVVEC